MKKYLKLIYLIIFICFIIFSFFEIKSYFTTYSNLFGVLYMLINLFILFLLLNLFINYKDRNYKLRVSKLFLIIILGIFSSFLLQSIISNIIYIDSSNKYIVDNNIFIHILKPILYSLLFILSIIELKFIKRT